MIFLRHEAPRCRPVRDLLVRYLTERGPAMDYTSLVNLTGKLVGLFWYDLERHHPGISSLRLDPAVATAWKTRAARRPDGTPRIDYPNLLLAVRAFYLDLVQWAATDPAAWAVWAAPCPVREADLSAVTKAKRRRTAHYQQRTRTLAPVLPAWTAAATRRLVNAEALLAAATAVPIGTTFRAGGNSSPGPVAPTHRSCWWWTATAAGCAPRKPRTRRSGPGR